MPSRGRASGGGSDPDWYTPVDDVDAARELVLETFNSGKTRSMDWRKRQIRGIRQLVATHEEELVAAIAADMGRPTLEARASDTMGVIASCDEFMAHLDEWTKPEPVSSPLGHLFASTEIRHEPLGVILIIAPWNYPVNLVLEPLLAAVAAGNVAVIKPSEHAQETTQLLTSLLPRYVDEDAVQVVNGAIPVSTRLLELKWDHIFFTGSEGVGRIVMRAAAEHLTPVTLELGGKSPCVVSKSADLRSSARRIIHGRHFNCGQSCISPDYILVERSVADELMGEMVAAVTEFYGRDPADSESFGRLIHRGHFDRLVSMLKERHGGEVVIGGPDGVNADEKYIPPTIILNPSVDSTMMQEEIFGPILPVLVIDSMEQARDFISERPKPLALYIFTTSPADREIILQAQSGAAVQNETLIHFTNSAAPFGGVGTSGIGAYHGKFGFTLLSHHRTVVHARSWTDPLLAVGRYPPYSPNPAIQAIAWLMFMHPPKWIKSTSKVALVLIAISLAAFLGYRNGKGMQLYPGWPF